MSETPHPLAGLAEIADRFDAAILDQWGVLHDGAKAPAGAIDAVTSLARAGKRLVVLSNSARLGSDAFGRLEALGYDPACFTGVVTSGETVRDFLRDRDDPFFAALGRKVFLIAREPTLIEGLDYRVVESPEQADFVLLGSATAPEQSLAENHAPLLARAAARRLPAVCANPDRVGVAASGFIEAPGTLAAFYERQGGTVRYIGKPHPEVYARVLALMPGIASDRILAIGDSLEHDIAGGRGAGCATAFIEHGIHRTDLVDPGGMDRLTARFGVTPDYRIVRLIW